MIRLGFFCKIQQNILEKSFFFLGKSWLYRFDVQFLDLVASITVFFALGQSTKF